MLEGCTENEDLSHVESVSVKVYEDHPCQSDPMAPATEPSFLAGDVGLLLSAV